MPIEFNCPHCGRLMRTPDGSAGKKGRCPDCGGIAPIPSQSTASGTAGTGPAAAGSAGAGSIDFACTQCGHAVRVPAAHAGKKGKCPHCQAINSIPMSSTLGASGKFRTTGGTTQPAAASGGALTFPCPQCQRQVKTPAAAAGKKGKCPHCAAVIQIPLSSQVLDAPAGQLTELPSSGGLTPLPDTGGLTPLPDLGGGLFPASGADDPFGLGGAGGGLGAPGSDPFADLPTTPGASDPFAGWSGAPASQAPYAASNPYASPSPSASKPKSKKRSGGGGSRRGLPWDRQEEGGFFKTVKELLFDTTNAFQKMSVSGGVGRPLMFAVLGSLFGAAFNTLYQILSGGAMMAMMLGAGGAEGEEAGFAALGFGAQIAIQAVAQLLGATLGTVISCFVSGAILHVLLMLFKGANEPYEATFRVVAYTLGAVSCLAVVPGCGGLVAGVAYPVFIILGLTNAHRTDAWRAVCAVLGPGVICCIGAVALGVMLFGIIAASQAILF